MLEVIAETLADATAAEEGGATQLDLKCAFEIDGLTPSLGMIDQICSHIGIKVIVMIRAHRKSFVLSKEDITVMCDDIQRAKNYGPQGFLLGALTIDGEIDVEAIKRFKQAAGDRSLNFHLAWEQTKDPEKSLATLIDLGVESVRTTGGQGLGAKAVDGTAQIKKFREQYEDKIDLFLAGGVTSENISQLVVETGVIHAHAGSSVRIPANTAGNVEVEKVKILRTALDEAITIFRKNQNGGL